MNTDAEFSFPSLLEDRLGPLEMIRQVTTKPKSMVVIAQSAHGPVVLKQADPKRLRHEHFLLADVLPSTGIRAPRALGLFEDGTESWLATEFVDGRRPEFSNKADRATISRWVAHLHVVGRSVSSDLPRSPVLLNPSERLEEIERVLSTTSASADDIADLALCRRLRNALPDILGIGAALPTTLTHGDLAEQNFVLADSGLTGLDWERAQIGNPLIDLWIVDPHEYRSHQIELGVSPEDCAPLAAFAAGTVLARLAHNIARKSPERRHRYLQTATDAAERALALRQGMS